MSCNDCNKWYVGQTSRRLEIRKGEHQGNIKYKDQYHNVVSKHILDSEVPQKRHSMNWDGIENFHKKKIGKNDSWLKWNIYKKTGK